VERCKLEIKTRLNKLEEFAVSNGYQLDIVTILNFLEQERIQTDKEEREAGRDESKKKSLLDSVQYDY
jgi:hypothetical protein